MLGLSADDGSQTRRLTEEISSAVAFLFNVSCSAGPQREGQSDRLGRSKRKARTPDGHGQPRRDCRSRTKSKVVGLQLSAEVARNDP